MRDLENLFTRGREYSFVVNTDIHFLTDVKHLSDESMLPKLVSEYFVLVKNFVESVLWRVDEMYHVVSKENSGLKR